MAREKGEAIARVLREQTLPRVKQMPGLVKGFWTRSPDGTHGTSMVVFESKQNADHAASMLRTAAPPSVTIDTIEVREVVADV
jgi:hypothetical protein